MIVQAIFNAKKVQIRWSFIYENISSQFFRISIKTEKGKGFLMKSTTYVFIELQKCLLIIPKYEQFIILLHNLIRIKLLVLFAGCPAYLIPKFHYIYVAQ